MRIRIERVGIGEKLLPVGKAVAIGIGVEHLRIAQIQIVFLDAVVERQQMIRLD